MSTILEILASYVPDPITRRLVAALSPLKDSVSEGFPAAILKTLSKSPSPPARFADNLWVPYYCSVALFLV